MATMKWTPDLSVGIDRFDSQHHTIVQMLAALDHAMRADVGRRAITPVLNGLIQTMASHFRAEEQAMSSSGFPGYAYHKREHDLFVRKMVHFQEKFDEGQVALTTEVVDFLDTWMAHHVLHTDMLYASHLAGRLAA